jgi:hypothetical protein
MALKGPGPGRPPGSPNKTTRVLKDAIMLAVCEVGDVGMYVDEKQITTVEQRGQLVGFLKWLLVHYPETFVRSLLARVLPLQLSASLEVTDNGPKAFATKEELVAEMRARGLPIAPTFLRTLPAPTNETPSTEQ